VGSSKGRRYTIEIKPSAHRALRLLPAPVRVRLVAVIDALADHPRPSGCKKLAGGGDRYRIRVGQYRIVYEVHDDRLVVVVIRIGHRRDVYRGL
jgi:mRNA interferase RelE/StbE